MQEWIVTLYNKEDLESFYDDMETEGGNLYIPDRKVGLTARRTISRNTHYFLTDEEAMEVEKDPRVWGVTPRIQLEESIKPEYVIENGEFDKRWQDDVSDTNWGLLRHSEATNRSNWGDTGTGLVTSDLTVTASGKNVDVVVVDGHIDPAHPEFAVMEDGSGGTRVVQYNWLQNDVGQGTGTYVYTPYVDDNLADSDGDGFSDLTEDNNHGCHVAGTIAGNSQGWAREANIYNMSPYGTNPNSGFTSFLWDYLRAWHNNKPINSATGRKNPTITNHSYGSALTFTSGSNRVFYRGVDFNPGRQLTVQELNDRGINTNDADEFSFPFYTTAIQADVQDAIDDGIIVVSAAGNDAWKMVNSSDQDYNNRVHPGSFSTSYYYHRGDGRSGYDPNITVGALGNNANEAKATFSNTGTRIDIFAAGEAINSSVHSTSYGNGFYGSADPRNGSYAINRYQGTSMAAPQVAGVLTLVAEMYPDMTQSEMQQWLYDTGVLNQMFDSGTDDATDNTSLQGGPNRVLYWKNIRSASGSTFPRRTHKLRPASGATYPRPRIRRRG